MPRRGERRVRVSEIPARRPAPTEEARIGVRELPYMDRHRQVTLRIDPSKYTCPTLAAQLADSWMDYHHKAALKKSTLHAQAIRSFVKFTGTHLLAAGLDPADARLDGSAIDLTEVFYAWENYLLAEYPEQSRTPWGLANSLLLVLYHRAERDQGVPDKLRKRAAAPTTIRKATGQPLDEFSNAERIALKAAAQGDIRALEARLARGRDLLAEGRDPREHGWRSLPNLVWAARHQVLTTPQLTRKLRGGAGTWPAPLQETREADGSVGVFGLMRGVSSLLFPRELDLQGFRVLLLLAMLDCTSEELHALHVPDLDFSSEGVRVVQTKNRAERIRADFHVSEPASEDPQDLVFEGRGEWDVPGLLRRLVRATAMTREVFAGEPWLFTAVEPGENKTTMTAGFADFTSLGRRFTNWIAAHSDSEGRPLEISKPHEIRRLRKTAKTTRVVALGGHADRPGRRRPQHPGLPDALRPRHDRSCPGSKRDQPRPAARVRQALRPTGPGAAGCGAPTGRT
ncbi:hypothetical protein PUR61_16510 [Streptomyces sp. BE20]|uniref:hypothetical protein n=1 Tax=Streptomyces sp. BE20 TaxID=3002525 RepID=UPI002E790741|nr:hypothetical protein [Streptomyces sp. BE20]MEE1823781.1 hypothetical protein [Streptomyces sp. BE20]